MQNLSPETGFLSAIGHAATARLGADHPLARAAAEALDSKTPAKSAHVHELLAQLGEADRDALLAEAHRWMREDLAAIWAWLPHAAQSGGMH